MIWVGLLLACHPITPASAATNSIYVDYDKEFRAFLANATSRVGKEVIKVERLSDRFTVPQKLTVKGTPREIGLTLGHVGLQAKATLPLLNATNRALNEKVIQLYKEVAPSHLDVIQAVAEVYKTPFEQIDVGVFEADFTTRMWFDLLQVEKFSETIASDRSASNANHHCSTASYYTAGRHLVGRNFDNPSDRPHFFTTVEMSGSYKVMGHTIYDITGWGVDGLNEKGLALCVTTAYSVEEPYPREPAILLGHLCQIVLQRCATVDEALALLRKVRVWFPFEVNHCLIADSHGRSVVVEWNPRRRG